MPTPRTAVAVTGLGDKIYVAGGLEADGSVSNRVEVYNPAFDSWSEIPPMPEGRHTAGALNWHDELLVIGGFVTEGFDEPTARVFKYSPVTGEWTENPPLERARGAFAYTLFEDIPVAVGGVEVGDHGRPISLDTAEWMDGRSEEWREYRSVLQLPRDHAAAASITRPSGHTSLRELHVIGGQFDVEGNENATLHESWSHLFSSGSQRAKLSAGRSAPAAAVIDHPPTEELGRHIYVFGGETDQGATGAVEAYDIETDSWTTLESMPTPRYGHGAAVVGFTVYLIGGSTAPHEVTGANEAFTP
jgi:non-specific serine/threonine protein kinase